MVCISNYMYKLGFTVCSYIREFMVCNYMSN